jgi:hypothetical protein
MRREIEEAGSAGFLSAAARSHLEACAACETLSRQQTNLQTILSGLGTVEAPGDFDYRLRARLAAEKRMGARAFPFMNLSFGLGSAAVALTLLLLGSAFVFVSFRTSPNNTVAGGKQVESKPVTTTEQAKGNSTPVTTSDPSAVAEAPTSIERAPSDNGRHSRQPPRAGGERREVAGVRAGKRFGTLDQTHTQARVLTPDQLAASYPTAAFPINASYQSLKVSVDDSRGASRTISLPSVSFGSQRTLSQTGSPLVASARDTW